MRWLLDSDKFNEWMNEIDYETDEAAAVLDSNSAPGMIVVKYPWFFHSLALLSPRNAAIIAGCFTGNACSSSYQSML